MTTTGSPETRQRQLDEAGRWLRRHGFAGVSPTPPLAARLAVRQRTRLATQLLLAMFIVAVGVTYTSSRQQAAVRGSAPDWLLVLILMVVGLVATQFLLHWWVRQADRRLADTLPRRVTLPARLGWRAVLGVPRAAIAVTVFAGAVVLALHAMSAPDSKTRYAAVVLLIGVCGAAVAMLVQLRYVLTRPVVADDEVSLSADLVMRSKDARDAINPSVLWALPISSVLDNSLGRWNAGWLAFAVLSAVTFALVSPCTRRSAVIARAAAEHAMGGTVTR